MSIDWIDGPATTELGRRLHLSAALERCRLNPANVSVEVTRPDFARSFPHRTTSELFADVKCLLDLEARRAAYLTDPDDVVVDGRRGMPATRSGALRGLDKAYDDLLNELINDDGGGHA